MFCKSRIGLYLCAPLSKLGDKWRGVSISKTLANNLAKGIADVEILLTFALPSARKGNKRSGDRKIDVADQGHKCVALSSLK